MSAMGHEKISQVIEVTCPKCASKTECVLKWPKGKGYYVCRKCGWEERAEGIIHAFPNHAKVIMKK